MVKIKITKFLSSDRAGIKEAREGQITREPKGRAWRVSTLVLGLGMRLKDTARPVGVPTPRAPGWGFCGRAQEGPEADHRCRNRRCLWG